MDEADESVGWEFGGRQTGLRLWSHVWGQIGITARVPGIGVFSWLQRQKEFSHSRDDLKERVQNLRKGPVCFTQVSKCT